jgi:hypothetical protein
MDGNCDRWWHDISGSAKRIHNINRLTNQRRHRYIPGETEPRLRGRLLLLGES